MQTSRSWNRTCLLATAAIPGTPAQAVGPYNRWIYIKNDNSGKCLEVADMSQAYAAAVVQWDCWGGRNQACFDCRLAHRGGEPVAAHPGTS